MSKFQVGDRVRQETPAGEVTEGVVSQSEPLRDASGKVLEREMLSITWDDGSVDHLILPEDVERIE